MPPRQPDHRRIARTTPVTTKPVRNSRFKFIVTAAFCSCLAGGLHHAFALEPFAHWIDQTHRPHNNDDPLPSEVAFPFSLELANANTLVAHWTIVPGYYLYRDKMQFQLINAPTGVSLDTPELPSGDATKDDEVSGHVEVYHGSVQVRLTVHWPTADTIPVPLLLETHFQGCAEGRLCYPPMTQRTLFTLPSLSDLDQIAERLASRNRLWTLAWFFGIGLLLAFTPCVFPMIPILSSLIVGQGAAMNKTRAFWLSLVYVLSMALTYTVAGVAAGLLGTNWQAAFQDPWIVGAFSAIFVALAFSMFGFYEFQIPARLQTRLTLLANHQSGGSLLGVAVMGLLSALIVGPCVAPPLAGALLYIGHSGDAALGGLALFCMSLGMGLPLLVIGTTAGHWLPRAGAWMNTVKIIFGILLLGVAAEMLERVVPFSLSLPFWNAAHETTASPLPFQRIEDTTALDRALAAATGRTVVLDFRADWCVECKRMERLTFSDPAVRAALSGVILLQADVTQNRAADQALLRRFEIIGPPALLFFGSDGIERKAARLVGFVEADSLLAQLQKIALTR